MNAQTTVASPVGEYYLRGVMETACGFKLNGDSTFQFFFSYGALDRFGEGRWTMKNDSAVFNSKPQPEQDFKLLQAEKNEAGKITIELKEMNPTLLRHMYCKIVGKGIIQEAQMNEQGVAEFKAQPLETIELLFEFCPEKRSVFTITSITQNHFSFSPQPWLMEIFFHDFHLSVTENGMTGGHPLSNETKFRYEKIH